MQLNTTLIKSALFIVIPVILLTACSQTTNNPLSNTDDNGGGYASEASRIQWINDDVISLADAAGTVYNGAYMRTTETTGLGTCATVGTDTTSSAIHSLVIRLGSNNGGTSTANDDCTCLDGRKRRGSIIVSYSGSYFDTAQTHTITFYQYFVNDVQLTGSLQTRRVVDSLFPGGSYYNVLINDSINMSQDPLNSQFVIWNASVTRKWVSGYATPTNRNDDVFAIAGNATITRANGHQYTFNISSPLQIAIDCNFAQSGIVYVNGYAGSRVLNYGSGSCDANAELSIGNTVYKLTLTP